MARRPSGPLSKPSAHCPCMAWCSTCVRTRLNPNRRATAYGLTEQQLREEQPQIFELLKTEFEAVIIGYGDDKGPQQVLPPQPPGIHSFVFPCSESEIKAPDQQRRFSPQHFVRQWQSPARGRSHHRLGAKCLGPRVRLTCPISWALAKTCAASSATTTIASVRL